MFRKKNLVGFFAGLSMIVSAQVFAAQNFNITGAGVRAKSMGGAFIGVADDATSVVWNPGGLTVLERPEISFVGQLVHDVYEGYNNPTHLISNFNSLAIPTKIGLHSVVSAAYQRQIDFFDEFSYTDDDDVHTDVQITGGVDTITLGFGTRITPALSVGVAPNLWLGEDERLENGEVDYNDSYSGFNLTLGVMADLSALETPKPLKIGVVARTPFELDVSDLTGEQEADYDHTFSMPWMVGVGASLLQGDNLTLALDYEMRNYGNTDAEQSNINEIRFGAEYIVITDMAVIPLRAGVKNVPNQVTESQGLGLSVGSGWIAERFSLDAAYWYEHLGDLHGDGDVEQHTVGLSTIIYF